MELDVWPILGNLIPDVIGDLTFDPDEGTLLIPFFTFESQYSEIQVTGQLFVTQPTLDVPLPVTRKRVGPVLDPRAIKIPQSKRIYHPNCSLWKIPANAHHLGGKRHKYNLQVLELASQGVDPDFR